jgi:hypothetical protein
LDQAEGLLQASAGIDKTRELLKHCCGPCSILGTRLKG